MPQCPKPPPPRRTVHAENRRPTRLPKRVRPGTRGNARGADESHESGDDSRNGEASIKKGATTHFGIVEIRGRPSKYASAGTKNGDYGIIPAAYRRALPARSMLHGCLSLQIVSLRFACSKLSTSTASK
jgi:hypothetical protein